MHLLLKTLTGHSVGINIENTRTVTSLDIKKMIQKKKGIDISEQTILLAGRTWEDNLTYSEFAKKNPHLHHKFDQTHLRLVITPIPEHLRTLVKLNYRELKELSADLAKKLSENSRTIRFKEEIHISTQTYWNDLSTHERVHILNNPKYTELISVLSQSTPHSNPKK